MCTNEKKYSSISMLDLTHTVVRGKTLSHYCLLN